jgi:hypothetical protein
MPRAPPESLPQATRLPSLCRTKLWADPALICGVAADADQASTVMSNGRVDWRRKRLKRIGGPFWNQVGVKRTPKFGQAAMAFLGFELNAQKRKFARCRADLQGESPM